MPFTTAQLRELPQALASISRQFDQITDQVQPSEPLPHHQNPFYTTCKLMTHICCVVIDGEVCTNVASTNLVEQLGLITTPHPHPYQFRRLDGNGEIEVKEQVQVSFKIGRYLDTITCDIIPIRFSHILLGKPWQLDRGAVHDGHTNQYSLNHGGKKFRLAPQTPEQIREMHTTVRAKLAAQFCVTPTEVVEEIEQVTFAENSKKIDRQLEQLKFDSHIVEIFKRYSGAFAANTQEECTKPLQVDQEAVQESPKVIPQPMPESSLCETPQRVVSSVQKEESALLLFSKEEEIVQHPSVDCPTIEHQTAGDIQSESPIEFPQSSPMINKDDLANVHSVLPKQFKPHLMQRKDWPQKFFSFKEFPQSGNSILAIQIGEPLRVLQYLNDGTNNFELLAEIQVLPALDANNSSTSIHNSIIDEQSPANFQGGGNNAVLPKTAKSDTCFARVQPPIIFFQSRDVQRFGDTVQGFLIKEPFQESGNDEVITSLPGDDVHPAHIDPPITQSWTRGMRELGQMVQIRAYCFKGGTFDTRSMLVINVEISQDQPDSLSALSLLSTDIDYGGQ